VFVIFAFASTSSKKRTHPAELQNISVYLLPQNYGAMKRKYFLPVKTSGLFKMFALRLV